MNGSDWAAFAGLFFWLLNYLFLMYRVWDMERLLHNNNDIMRLLFQQRDDAVIRLKQYEGMKDP